MLKENGTCRTLCHVPDVTGDDAKFINDRIREDYAINWLIDGLPAAEMKVDTRTKELFFDMGFNLGDNEGKRQNLPALNNHYEIVLRYVKFSSFKLALSFLVDTTALRQPHTALSVFSFGQQGTCHAKYHDWLS